MEQTKKHVIIGTAGHIDHGKSALLKSLTGVDPDRLKEEKERGMTTDLGFVFYGNDVTIIDVPGHEKFVRHMVAGASTIDFVIFVVAADDGVMPQTIEHLEILKLLSIQKGCIVITKKDLVDDELLQIVINDIKELVNNTFLENVPIVAVSNETREGIDDLRILLDAQVTKITTRKDRGVFRLPIDRCFVIKGFGTVVAGTVLSGSVKTGDVLELLPEKQKVKVRGIQVHNNQVTEVGTGYRTAINIAGATKEEIDRGDTLAQPGFFEPSEFINGSLYLLASTEKPLRNLTRLRIHIGTKELFGRVVLLDKKILQPGDKAMVQFRLEIPAVSDVGDRYVIRTYSPQVTVGGGTIIEPKAQKAKGFDEKLVEHLQKIEVGDPKAVVEEDLVSNLEIPRKIEEISHDWNMTVAQVSEIVKKLLDAERVICISDKRGLYYSQKNYLILKEKILATLHEFHEKNPTLVGMPQLELHRAISKSLDKSLLDFMFKSMTAEKIINVTSDYKVSLFDFKVILDKGLDETARKVEKLVKDAGYTPPTLQEILSQGVGSEDAVKKAYRYMLDKGILINVGESVVLHIERVKEAEEKLVQFLKKNNELRVSQFRDLLGASRKYALPLLIYFDTRNVTIKRGDVRVLGQKYR